MPRKKKIKKRPISSKTSKESDDDKSFNYLKNWLQTVQQSLEYREFQYESEIEEINSDEESDEYECNLKELEVRFLAVL